MEKRKDYENQMDYKYKPVSEWCKVLDSFEWPKMGTWIPISIASFIVLTSHATIRSLCQNKIIPSFKYKVGPVFVELNELQKWKSDKKNKNKK